MEPVIEPSSAGGISSTIGPSWCRRTASGRSCRGWASASGSSSPAAATSRQSGSTRRGRRAPGPDTSRRSSPPACPRWRPRWRGDAVCVSAIAAVWLSSCARPSRCGRVSYGGLGGLPERAARQWTERATAPGIHHGGGDHDDSMHARRTPTRSASRLGCGVTRSPTASKPSHEPCKAKGVGRNTASASSTGSSPPRTGSSSLPTTSPSTATPSSTSPTAPS